MNYTSKLKRILRKLAMRCLALGLGLGIAAHGATNIVYDGSNPSMLGTFLGTANSLFPSDSHLTGNSVAIVSNSVPVSINNIYGGASTNVGVVISGNMVSIQGNVKINDLAFGAYVEKDGDAINNSVTVDGNSVITTVIGGVSMYGDTIGNTVSIANGSTIRLVIGGDSCDGGRSISNHVSIAAGSTINYVCGGTAKQDSYSACYNTVSIADSTVGGVEGGYVRYNGDADYNTVTLMSSTVSNNVCGGYVGDDTYVSIALLGDGNAIGNSVTVMGGHVGGDIYGGYVASNGTTTGNAVVLGGNLTFGADSEIYGGYRGFVGDCFGGNTLVISNALSGLKAHGVYNFQNYEFYLPNFVRGGDGYVALTVDTADFSTHDGSGRQSEVTGVHFEGGGRIQEVGETFTLMAVTNTASGTLANDGGIVPGKKGATLAYDVHVDWAPNGMGGGWLYGSIVDNSVATTDGAKALSEGTAAGMTTLNDGGDIIASKAMGNAVGANGTFFGAGGGKNRYTTGSHVDVQGFSFAAGVAYGTEIKDGRLTIGAFLESGHSSYKTFNATSFGDVEGDGTLFHIGGGVLGRFDFNSTAFDCNREQSTAIENHFYTEASLRAGRLDNQYDSADLGGGVATGYDYTAGYFGAHLGGGYVWGITEGDSMDFSAKYFWTHQAGKSVTLTSGDPVEFKDMESHRIRLGGRYSHAISGFSPYCGVAGDYEMAGKAKANTYGMAIDAPSLHGFTAVGELGVALAPWGKTALTFDVGLQGNVGKKRGFTGSLQMSYVFD